MAPKTSAEPELRVPSSITSSQDDAEPWRQSSFDLHRGLEVTEIPQNGPKVDSAPSEGGRLADLPVQSPFGAAAPPRRFEGLAPEDAAPLEGLWWDRPGSKDRRSP
jgi:hypothetical protein